MSKQKLPFDLGALGFKKAGPLLLDEKFKELPVPCCLTDIQAQWGDEEEILQLDNPSAYVWVAEQSENKTAFAIYVGKAGQGFFPTRLAQHRRGTVDGKKSPLFRARLLKRILDEEGYQVTVYERESKFLNDTIISGLGLKEMKLNPLPTVSMNASEEEVFIEYFKNYGIEVNGNKELIGNKINGIDHQTIEKALDEYLT